MANVSDPKIAEAYQEVRNASSETNWFLLGYQDNKTITFLSKGTGGIDELASNLTNNGCFYGYARVTIKADETTRTKFVFISFKGDDAPVMRKGNMSVHIANVKSIIKDFSIEFSAAEVAEVSEAAVLKKISAANY